VQITVRQSGRYRIDLEQQQVEEIVMPILIKLTFPAGRYHATEWGRHVNEGAAEWPPSPWRLLRALVAVWKRTCADISETQIKRILEPLTEPPKFRLPPHRVAHTRHYMPWEKKGPADRALIFDTFVSISREEQLYIGWSAAKLSIDDRLILSRLLENLTTLGRAESWTSAELSDDNVELDIAEADKTDSNPIRVFCPDPQSVFADEHYPKHDAKKLASGTVNPADYLFDCPCWHLCLDTETIHAKRWPSVPGSRWVNYARPSENGPRQKRRAVQPRARRTINVVRFLIDAPVLPRTLDTLPFAEAMRSVVKSRCPSPILSGHGPDGQPMKDHVHAYYLPTSEEDDPRHLTHVTLYAKAGFSDDELRALESLRKFTWPRGEKARNYQLRIIGIGKPEDFMAGIFGPSKDWVSATPFVAHRYPKGDMTIERIAADLIAKLGIGAATVDQVELSKSTALQSREFKRIRRKDEGQPRPFAHLRIQFPHSVNGPLSLGYGAHFGLGLFTAVMNHD
jgi:CRISPR-associated protein Csb2